MRTLIFVLVSGTALACNCGPENKPDGGAADAGTDAGADGGADGGTCSLVGTWRGAVPGGPFAGSQLDWTFSAGGTTLGAIAPATTINGTWALAGTTVSLTDTSSTPTTIACPSAQVGTYTVAFSQSCATVSFTLGTEPCAGRQVVVSGFNGTRQ